MPDTDTETEQTQDQSSTMQQLGLRLPDGVIAWESYKDFDLASIEDRHRLVQSLAKTAQNLNWPQGVFLGQYGWVTRTITVADVAELSIIDPAAIGPIGEGADGEGDSTGGSDSAEVRGGPVGGAA